MAELGKRLQAKIEDVGLTPSEWACKHRFFKDNQDEVRLYSFEGYEFLRAIQDDRSPTNDIEKSNQVGISEILINGSLYMLDIEGRDVLYLMPTERDVSDFSSSRIRLSIQRSEYLQRHFTNIDNVRHKIMRNSNFYLRGTKSKSGLASVPVSALIIDEFDFTNQEQVSDAQKRLSGHTNTIQINASKPTIPDFGIDKIIKETKQNRWNVKCLYCHKWQPLEWEANVNYKEVESVMFCRYCTAVWSEKQRLDIISKGEWRPDSPKSDKQGYHISQLYSPARTIQQLADEYNDIKGDEAKATAFYNGVLGIPYVAKGSSLNDVILGECLGDYYMKQKATHTTMGIDVGRVLHVVIDKWKGDVKKHIWIGEVGQFEELPNLMKIYGVDCCVIDGAYDARKAREFIEQFRGKSFACFYPEMRFVEKIIQVNDETQTVKADRTATLDKFFARYKMKQAIIPLDRPKDFFAQLKAPKRIYMEKKSGGMVARYKETSADHYTHAGSYSEIAHDIIGLNPVINISFIED